MSPGQARSSVGCIFHCGLPQAAILADTLSNFLCPRLYGVIKFTRLLPFCGIRSFVGLVMVSWILACFAGDAEGGDL